MCLLASSLLKNNFRFMTQNLILGDSIEPLPGLISWTNMVLGLVEAMDAELEVAKLFWKIVHQPKMI